MSRYPTLLNSNTFISLPTDNSIDIEISIESVGKLISDNELHKSRLTYLKISSVIRRLLLSLKGTTLSLQEILKLWEIRLISMIFATGQNLQVNHGQLFKIQSTKFIKNEVDILVPELYKINKLRKQHELNYNLKQRQIDQFPREVSTEFKFLLLKIRYGSSLMLINEYYNHMWRILDRTFLESSKISFGIILVLTARQEYLTLLNLVDSILQNISIEDKELVEYYNRLVIIKTIAHLIRVEKEHLTLSDLDIKEQFNTITDMKSLTDLNKILNMVAPVYNDPESKPIKEENIYKSDMTENYQILEKQVQEIEITGRIMCTFCGICEIEIEYLNDDQLNDDLDDDGNGINEMILKGLRDIKKGWIDNVTKYYGLE